MKAKMLVALALSSLLAASISFAGPEIEPVDDVTSSSPTDSSMPSSSAPDNSMSTPNGDMSSPSNNIGASSPSDANGTTGGSSNDDMSADTATGDDDY